MTDYKYDINGRLVKIEPAPNGMVSITREVDIYSPPNRKERRAHAARNRKGRK